MVGFDLILPMNSMEIKIPIMIIQQSMGIEFKVFLFSDHSIKLIRLTNRASYNMNPLQKRSTIILFF